MSDEQTEGTSGEYVVDDLDLSELDDPPPPLLGEGDPPDEDDSKLPAEPPADE